MVPLLVGNTATPSRTPFPDWKEQNHKGLPLEYMFNTEKALVLSTERAGSNETIITTYQTTRRHIPENCYYNHRHGNLQFEISFYWHKFKGIAQLV
jgi:hypothetical protein